MRLAQFQYKWISDYRGVLMGIAIFGVMCGHIASSRMLPKVVEIALGAFSRLVFTEGFLLLSGLGLYYSFSKDSDVAGFYLKRLKRLYFPFLIMVLPYYLFTLIAEDEGAFQFIMNITALSFFQGEGRILMWYVSISLLLYLLFPLFYKVIFRKNGPPVVGTLLLMLIACGVSVAMARIAPSYYGNVSIGFDKVPIFILGMLLGYLSKEGKQVNGITLIVGLGLLLFVCRLLKQYGDLGISYYEMSFRLLCIATLCLVLTWWRKHHEKSCGALMKVLSWFGRYSLELYISHMLLFAVLTKTCIANNLHAWFVSVAFAILICQPLHKGIDSMIRTLTT